MIQSTKKLHVVLKNQFSITVLDQFIHHIDAVNSHTLLYLTDFYAKESDIVRLTEKIKLITILSEGVCIYYESGAELLIRRLYA